MKDWIKALVVILCLSSSSLFSQNLVYSAYNWEEDPKLHDIPEADLTDNYTIVKDKSIVEYVYEESGNMVVYETTHMIIRFNNAEGIEARNKVYISYRGILEEMELKARTITSDGKVVELDKSQVKKSDIEDIGECLFFAMEGVDVGSEIEYLYTNKKSPRYYNEWTVQGNKLKLDFSFDLYTPENIVFESKGYNGFPDLTVDSVVDEKNHLYASLDRIEPLYEEKYSAHQASKMRFEFQFAYNTDRSKTGRIYTWEGLGLDIYKVFYNFEKAELKAVKKVLSKQKILDLESDEQKVQAFEKYMKTSIGNEANSDAARLNQVFTLKYGNELGLIRAYIGAANAMGMDVQLVVTTSGRMSRKFSKDFASWNNLSEYLVYFPSIKKYISPATYISRIGFPPPGLMGNYALFIKETSIGDIKTSISKVKKLPYNSYEKSSNNITAKVTFSEDDFTPVIDMKQEHTGYSAYYTQPFMLYYNDQQKEEFLKQSVMLTGEETKVLSSEMEGIDSEDILVNPFVIKGEIETPHLIENAGRKYLFKVGEIIGQQVEMYQEKKRQTDAEITYTHSYTRVIEVLIPEGYKISNMDDVLIDKKVTISGETTASFVSSYKVEGNVMKITVYEDYQALVYPKSHFEAYRAVINAAADFNKVVLILEKK